MPMVKDNMDQTKVLNRRFYTELACMSVVIFIAILYFTNYITKTIKWSDAIYFFGSLWIALCLGGFFICVSLDYLGSFSKMTREKVNFLIVYALKCWKTSFSATMLSSYLNMVSGLFMMLQLWLYHKTEFEYKLLIFFGGFSLVTIGFVILILYFSDIVKTYNRHKH